MKKLLIFAVIAMVAGAAMAQTLSFVGNSYVYNDEMDTWYRASGPADGGWANLSPTMFDAMNFGIVNSLTLGGQAQTWWDDSATHPTTLVQMGYNVDGLGDNLITLPWTSYASNNDKWENMTGVDVVATTGVGGGSHTVTTWFQAGSPASQWDNNGGLNYTADFQTPIPEPATMSLLGLGALAIVLRRKIRK